MTKRSDISPLLSNLAPSATLAINEISHARQAAGQPVFKFGLGQSPFPVPDEVVDSLKAHAAEKDYLPIRGLASLRAVLQSYLEGRTGQHYSSENIMIGPGSKELMFILQLVLTRQLILPQGAWVSYEPQAILAGRDAKWLPTRAEDRWRLTPDTLDTFAHNATEPLLLILNYPGNPTGQSYTATELSALADVCRKHDIIVLSDEIYGELAFDGDYQSIARFYPEGTIVSTGLSKWCGAGGWRLGVFALPDDLAQVTAGMAIVASESFTSVSAPTQYAAIEAFKLDGSVPAYLKASQVILKGINDILCEKLLAANITVSPAEGGFYVMPDFQAMAESLAARGIKSSDALCAQLLESTGVALLPGTCFGFPESQLITRLAFVDFDGAELLADPDLSKNLEDSAAIKALLARHPALSRQWQGIDALCAWANA